MFVLLASYVFLSAAASAFEAEECGTALKATRQRKIIEIALISGLRRCELWKEVGLEL
jgi:hypothetical protein